MSSLLERRLGYSWLLIYCVPIGCYSWMRWVCEVEECLPLLSHPLFVGGNLGIPFEHFLWISVAMLAFTRWLNVGDERNPGDASDSETVSALSALESTLHYISVAIGIQFIVLNRFHWAFYVFAYLRVTGTFRSHLLVSAKSQVLPLLDAPPPRGDWLVFYFLPWQLPSRIPSRTIFNQDEDDVDDDDNIDNGKSKDNKVSFSKSFEGLVASGAFERRRQGALHFGKIDGSRSPISLLINKQAADLIVDDQASAVAFFSHGSIVSLCQLNDTETWMNNESKLLKWFSNIAIDEEKQRNKKDQ